MTQEDEYIISTCYGKEIVRERSDPNGGTADYVYISNSGRLYRLVENDGTMIISASIESLENE